MNYLPTSSLLATPEVPRPPKVRFDATAKETATREEVMPGTELEGITVETGDPIKAEHIELRSVSQLEFNQVAPIASTTAPSRSKRLPWRSLKSKKPAEHPAHEERSTRHSLEMIKMSGNLFQEKASGMASEEERIERREFLVALMASLLKYGGATHLVENLMVSVAQALHIRAQCNCFPKMMFVTMRGLDSEDPSKLQSRVLSLSPCLDLGHLEACDQLAMKVAAGIVTFEAAKAELNSVLVKPPCYHWVIRLLAFAVAGGSASTLFYGGRVLDGIVGMCLGLIVGGCDLYGGRNSTFATINDFVCAFLCAFIARLLETHAMSASSCYLSAALGPLVYLLPGFSTTTAVTEIAAGAYMSGSARLFASFFCFLQLGFGLVVGSRMAAWAPINEEEWCENEVPAWAQLVLFVALVASLAVLNRIPPSRHLCAAIAAAGVGHSASVFLSSFPRLPPDTQSFLASFAVGTFGCIYARLASRPPLSTVVLGILVLVPGGIGVRGVAAFFSDDSVSGVQFGTEMFGVALSLTLGLLVAKMAIMPAHLKSKPYYQPSLL